MVPWPKPPEQVIRAPDWGWEGGRTRKSEMGARLVITVCFGWRVGFRDTVRESAKWEPMNKVVGSKSTSVAGIEDYNQKGSHLGIILLQFLRMLILGFGG